MRTQPGATTRYASGRVPDDYVREFVQAQFDQIAAMLNALADGQLDVTTVIPPRPREGMLRLFDGTSANPGSGRGVYCYSNAAWRFLG